MTTFRLTPEMLLEHRAFMQTLARSLLADDASAEDAVQEAWLAALKSGPRSQEKLKPWLARVVKNIALNIRRSEGRRSAREKEQAQSEAVPSAHEIVERFTTQRQVVDALLALKETHQAVLYLHYYEGLPPREIAARLELPVETVRSRTRRALDALRKELDRRVDGGRDAWCAALAFFARDAVPKAAGSLLVAKVAAGAVLLFAVGMTWWALTPSEVTLPPLESPPLLRALALSDERDRSLRTAVEEDRDVTITEQEPTAAPAAVRGRVVDMRTKEPVRDLDVVIASDAGEVQRARTDPDGHFVTAPVRLGEVRLTLVDGPLEKPVTFHSLREGGELTIQADVGPTFTLDATLPERMAWSDFECLLLERHDRDGWIAAGESVVRDALVPWVRFAPMPALSLVGGGTRSQFRLELVSRDRSVVASALVHAFPGIHARSVTFDLVRGATVEGLVSGPNGAPVQRVRIVASDDGGATFDAETDGEGRYRIGPLSPATWRVETRSALHVHEARELMVENMSEQRIDFTLREREVETLRGRIRTDSGRSPILGPVRLITVENPEQVFDAVVEDGSFELALPLRTDAGAPQSYRLVPPRTDHGVWRVPDRIITPPFDDAVLHLEDTGPTFDLAFRVFDESSGMRLEAFRSSVLPDPHELGSKEALALRPDPVARDSRFGATAFEALPDRGVVYWMIELDGYRSVRGDTHSLRAVDGRLTIDVFLQRSFEITFLVACFDENGERVPLPGAEIRTVGGTVLGRTLDDGRVHLALAYDPGRIEIVLDGWRVESWEGFRRGKRVQPITESFVVMTDK